MRLCSINVGKRSKDDRSGYFSPSKDISDKLIKFDKFWAARWRSASGPRWSAHCKVDSVCDTIYNIFYENISYERRYKMEYQTYQ